MDKIRDTLISIDEWNDRPVRYLEQFTSKRPENTIVIVPSRHNGQSEFKRYFEYIKRGERIVPLSKLKGDR